MMSLRQFIGNAEQIVGQAKLDMAMKLQRGSTTTMEQYNREVGRAEGLDIALKLFKDMLGKIEDMERQKDLPEMDAGAPK